MSVHIWECLQFCPFRAAQIWTKSEHDLGTLIPEQALTSVAIFGGLQALGTVGVFSGPVLAAVAVWIGEIYAQWRGPRLQ